MPDRPLVLLWCARIGHFSDAEAVDATLCAIGAETHKTRFILCVDHDCDDLLHGETKVDPKYVTVARNQFRARDRWMKDFGVTIVILQKIQRLAEARAGREYSADPVMNEPVRHIDLLSGLPGREALNVDLAAAQCIELRTALGARQAVYLEKRIGNHLRLGRADIPVERCDRARLQIGSGRGGEVPEHDDGGEKSGPCHVWLSTLASGSRDSCHFP